jgi:tRNA(adenine34) deaminase
VFDNYELDEFWMRQALALADSAAKAGDVPIGAVVVSAKNELMAGGFNRRERDGDPTAHAEIVALRAAAARGRHWRLDGATLYSTLEPCAMCAGALVNARVSRVVYGASDPKAGAVASVYSIGVDGRLNHRFRCSDGVLADECLERLQRFFEDLRADGQK